MNAPLRRVAVTLAVLAALVALRRVPWPGLDPDLLATIPPGSFPITVLGLQTWVTAHLFVELGALTREKWRAWRVGPPEDRARLWKATRWVWLACVGIQGFALAVNAEYIGDGAIPLVAEPGVPFRLLTLATLAGGSALVGLAVGAIERWGFGQGFAVLAAATALEATWNGFPLAKLLSDAHRTALVPVLCALFAAFYGAWRLLPARVAPGVPLLSGGVVGIGYAAVVPPTLVLLDIAPDPARDGLLGLAAAAGVSLAVATLFHLPWNVAPVLGCTEAEAWAALRRTWPVTLVVAVLAASVTLVPWFGPVALDLGALALLFAYGWDLLDEWHARAALPDPVVAWELHRVYAVAPALAALDAAGVPARARGLRARGLLHFVGPYIPVQILVPRARRADADAVLRAATAGGGAAAPEAAGSAPETAETGYARTTGTS